MMQFMLIISVLLPFVNSSLHIVSESNKQFDISILNLSESDFYNNIWLRNHLKSQPILLPIPHNKITSIHSVYKLWLTTFAPLQSYVQDFNTKSFTIMQQSETQCLNIMYNMYYNNIYKNWVSINDVKKQTDEQTQSSKYSNAKKNTFSSFVGTLYSL
jgi:hypothetical protein